MGDGSRLRLGEKADLAENNTDSVESHLERLGLGKFELHPDAHLDAETLAKLEKSYNFGDPSNEKWMGPIVGNNKEIPEAQYPQILKAALKRLSIEDRLRADLHLAEMTYIANSENQTSDDNRREYQRNERALMNMALGSIRNQIKSEYISNEILNCVALRGGKFFEATVTSGPDSFTGLSVEAEAKRILLTQKIENGDKPRTSLAVGIGALQIPQNIDISKVKVLMNVDDCQSTAATQVAFLQRMLEEGFRPEKVVIAVTVSTTEGARFLENQFEILKSEFELPHMELVFACAAPCESVNAKMYLQTINREAVDNELKEVMLVGDMGAMNVEVEM